MTNLLAVDIKNQYFGSSPNAAKVGSDTGSLINTLIPNAIVAAGLIFLFMIMFAGFKMVVGAGAGQSAQDAAKGKTALTWSIVGFLIVIFGYLILQVVGAMFGLDFTLKYIF